MRCLHCTLDIPATFLEDWAKSREAESGGRFRCPHCNADHVRREIDPLPSGERQFTYRLWGHLKSFRKKKQGGSGSSDDRRP
jgi:hypothetical protein